MVGEWSAIRITLRLEPMTNVQSARARPIIYLGCPYTHSDPKVREERFEKATRAAAHLIEKGHIVYSPITMTHPIDLVLAAEGDTLGSAYWVAFDQAFMECCAEMLVLKLDGWEQSSGIQREMEFLKKQGRPVRFLDPNAIV